MKLLRAICPCGYVTQKARSGYHLHTWWFAVFERKTGTLSDVRADLPETEHERVSSLTMAIYHETPRDDLVARRQASARMAAIAEETDRRFIDQETAKLRVRYASIGDCLFDPEEGSEFSCPSCSNMSLVLRQVEVVAFCKAACGLEYRWPDSETSGCPQCGYRPHRFRTESEPSFATAARVLCFCRCSSTTDCASEIDGFCPKCGACPDSYERGEIAYCGVHHEQLMPYQLPGNYLFINTGATRSSERTPNAKFWGDAKIGESSEPGFFCPSCEAEHKVRFPE